MNDFLSSVKADLLDRRIAPLLALVAAGLLAAGAYALLGGGSTTSSSTTSASAAPAGTAGIAVTQASNTDGAVAETTSGVADQHQGSARNPFAPLPGTLKAPSTAASTPSTSSSSSASTPSSGTSTSSGSGSTPVTPSSPSAPAKPHTVYDVAVLFGVIPTAGTTTETPPLTPYESLQLLTPLPSSKQPLVVFRGVTSGGKSATFTLVGEAILHGNGTCLPSETQCQAVDLQVGQSEQLEYLSPAGETVTYELRIVSIDPSTGFASSGKSVLRGESKPGRELLNREGLLTLPGLRYSASAGVLVSIAQPAFAARAHAAAQRAHRA